MTALTQSVEHVATTLVRRVLASRVSVGHWEGRLSSSPLSTATAVIALYLAEGESERVRRGLAYLESSQNADGGFGDTNLSVSNISTTALCWAALGIACRQNDACTRTEAWLTRAAGSLEPGALGRAIAARYGKDSTFSVPILTALAISGRLGASRDGWKHVPQLPFELAACPHQWFQWLRLPVVSYALPALIAIGLVRHSLGPVNMPSRCWRDACIPRVLRILDEIQPANGGFLEAVPLTSFVTMSVIAAGLRDHPVAQRGIQFLRSAVREDGSWPIDTNLATWVTTLAINALAADGRLTERLNFEERTRLASWLLDQQYVVEHPYTHAAPGGWAWTNLPGGVPDADDTAGALVALHHLEVREPRLLESATQGLRWLCGLQNSDGGVPTFCRGWGHLPFDRSSPDITAHALRAWTVWLRHVNGPDRKRIAAARRSALRYLANAQHPDGRWVPLWFGNQLATDNENPAYGTARVLMALADCGNDPAAAQMASRGIEWFRSAQNSDGGWGGDRGTPSSIEETALALDALVRWLRTSTFQDASLLRATRSGVDWLHRATDAGSQLHSSPIGFYFAKLWYFEELYPLLFTTSAFLSASKFAAGTEGRVAQVTALAASS